MYLIYNLCLYVLNTVYEVRFLIYRCFFNFPAQFEGVLTLNEVLDNLRPSQAAPE